MQKKLTKLLFLIIAICLLFSSAVLAGTQDRIDDLQREKDDLNGKIENKEQELSSLDSQISQVDSEIKKLDAQISKSQNELNNIQASLNELEIKIEENTRNLGVAKLKLASNEDLLAKRLREQYMADDTLYLEILAGSSNLAEMFTKIEMMQSVIERDNELIEFTNNQINYIKVVEVELDEQKREYQEKLEIEKQKKIELENANSEKQSFMETLQNDKSLAEAEYDQFVEKTMSIDSQILELQKKLEEERKAREEALKRAKSGSPAISGNGELNWPVRGYNSISSYYGYRIHPIFKTQKFHSGIDIPAPIGTPIRAAASGIVIYSGWQGGYGNTIMVSHGDGLVTLYGHNSSLNVSVGDYVETGQIVSYCGSTGYSTGPHLHFEVRKNGATTDPLGWL